MGICHMVVAEKDSGRVEQEGVGPVLVTKEEANAVRDFESAPNEEGGLSLPR